MNVGERIEEDLKKLNDLPYAFSVNGCGIYVKRISMTIHGVNGYQPAHHVELFYLNSNGKETQRQFVTLGLYDLFNKINRGLFKPINPGETKLLPSAIQIIAFRTVQNDGVVVKTKNGKIYYGLGRYTTRTAVDGWNEFIEPIKINRSSMGWSFVGKVKNPDGDLIRVGTRLSIESFREVSKADLMEILV